MKKIILGSMWVIIFLFLTSGVASTQTVVSGLQPGANVKIVKKDGNAFEGKIIKTNTTEYVINTTKEFNIKKYLKDIKKITDTGKTYLGGGVAYRPLHEYVTTNDQSFQGIYFNGSGMVFEIDLGTYGIQKGIS